MPVPEPSSRRAARAVRRAARAASAIALLALLAASGCTTDYIESAVRIGSAEVGAQPQFRWTRTSGLRIAGASSVYVAILPPGRTMPSHDHEPTFRDFTANDLPWRLARLLGTAWDGPYAAVVAPGPQPLPEALAAAALAGATYVAVPQLRDDGGPRSLWHRRTFTLEVTLLESATGRQVDRILVQGRAAFDEDEVPEAALVASLNELARAMTGDPAATDDRLGYLFR